MESTTGKTCLHPEGQRQDKTAGHTDYCRPMQQAMVKNALEPEWEAKFEPCSYGFRPGRSCHDAIGRIFSLAQPQSKKKWVVDADIKGAFDHISHDTLMTALDGFPAKKLVHQWLKAGILERGIFAKTEMGTPQGGVISPLLLKHSSSWDGASGRSNL